MKKPDRFTQFQPNLQDHPQNMARKRKTSERGSNKDQDKTTSTKDSEVKDTDNNEDCQQQDVTESADVAMEIVDADNTSNLPTTCTEKQEQKKHKKDKTVKKRKPGKRSKHHRRRKTHAHEEESEEDEMEKTDSQDSQPSTMDVTVHRIRHLEYLPKPIVCLRATPAVDSSALSSSSSSSSFVALSRENGSVELKAPNEKFRTIAEIAGYKQKVVNVMAWTCGIMNKNKSSVSGTSDSSSTSTTTSSRSTLVGGSRDGTLFVVDFSTGVLTGMTASGGGGVFALTSICQHCAGRCCSPTSNSCSQLVAAGCEDGSIRIWKVVEYRKLELVSILPSASGASILSLAWRKTAAGQGSVLFAGISDGTIRRYDCDDMTSPMDDGLINPQRTRNYDASTGGAWKSRLRMTIESLGRNTPTQVWALQALADGIVVSGDSLGHVQFWDGDTGTLLQSFDQNDNKADVLEIAVASDECKIFASGVDSRVVCIERPSLEAAFAAKDTTRKWILSQAQRPHTHDVKAMTCCRQQIDESDSRTRRLPVLKDSTVHEVLCTGGVDTKLCTYFVEGFKKLRPQSLYPWPAFSPVAQATDARVLVIRREGQIDLYRLAPEKENISDSEAVPEDESHIGTIELGSVCNLAAVTISDNGQYLAACDPLALHVFRIEYVSDGDSTSMVPTKLSVNTKQIRGSIVSLKFGSNDTLIAAASDGSIHVFNMLEEGDEDIEGEASDTCSHTVTLKQKKAQHKDALFPVQAISFSADKMWFATLQGGQDCSSICIFSCKGDGKTYRHWWSLPDLERPATAVKFLNTTSDAPQVLVSCSNFAFYNFDISKRKLAPWSEENGVPVSKNLPQELVGRNDYPVRIASNPASPLKILLVSSH